MHIIGLPVYHWSILAEELESVFCDTCRELDYKIDTVPRMLVQSLSLNFPI